MNHRLIKSFLCLILLLLFVNAGFQGRATAQSDSVELANGVKHIVGVKSFKTIVTRSELPITVQNFTKITVQSSNAPFAVKEIGINEFVGRPDPYEARGYGSSLPSGGTYYVLTILYDDTRNPLAFYETTINVLSGSEVVPTPSEQPVNTQSFGIKLNAGITQFPEGKGYRTYVNRSQLPSSVQNFAMIEVQTSFTMPDLNNITLVGIGSYNDSTGYSSAVPTYGTFYPVVILFDGNQRPLGYYIGQVNVTGDSQSQPLPTATPKSTITDPNQYGNDIDPNYSNADSPLFIDIDSHHWAYSAIKDLNTRAVITGYPDGRFRPDRVVTRAEFAKIMVLAAGLTPEKVTSTTFSDIKSTDWYAPFIETAKDFLNGYTLSNGSIIFNPNAPATREDVSVALVKLKGYDKSRLADNSIIQAMFKDYDSISPFARDYVALAVENKLVSGFPDETFKAQASVTRAQASAMLYRAYQYGNDNKDEQGIKGQVPISTPKPNLPQTVTDTVYGY
jgi:hypothetical protein